MAYTRQRYAPARARRNRRGVSRRSTHWVRIGTATGAISSGSVIGLDLMDDNYLDPGARLGSTVTRVRLSVSVLTATSQTMIATSILYLGMVVDRFELGDYPKPSEDRNSVDWLYWRAVPVAEIVATGLATTQTDALSFAFTDDIKSQRKFYEQGDHLMLSIQPFSFSVAESMVNVSTLVKLS